MDKPMITMHNFRAHRKEGRDYSIALRDMLPTLIGELPMSKQEIAKAAGRDFETVTRIIEKLRDKIHIAEWRRGTSGPITPFWLWGPGEDAPKPAAYSTAEKSRRYRETPNGLAVNKAAAKRWRNSESGNRHRKAAMVRRKFRRGGVAAIDPLLAAIIGASKGESL